MANEQESIYIVDPAVGIVPPNGQFNGRINLVTTAGAQLPAAGIPTLPTSNGDYTLRVTGGVYSWVLEGT